MLGQIMTILIFIIFIIFLIRLFQWNKNLFLLIFPILYVNVWLIISSLYLELMPSYINDLAMYSFFNYSTLKLLLYEFVFLFAIYLGFHSRKNKIRWKTIKSNEPIQFLSLSNKVKNTYFFISFLVIVLWGCDIYLSGSVLSNPAITRFNYWDNFSQISIARYAVYFINPIVFILGIIFKKGKGKDKLISVIFTSIFFVFSYLIGNEFSSLIAILIFFFIPTLIFTKHKISLKNKILFGFIFISIFLIGGYIKMISSDSPESFFYRLFVLQGDLWFATDLEVAANGNNIEQLFNEVFSIFDPSIPSGMYYMMKLVMPSKNLNSFIDSNVALYSGFPALEVAIFGYYMAVPVVFIEGIIYGKFLRFVMKKIKSNNLFVSTLVIFILIQYNKAFTMCGYSYLCNILPIISILFVIVYQILKKYKRKEFYKNERYYFSRR